MQKSKILAFLLALVISVGLWFYAVTVVNPDDSVNINNIKVRFDGADVLEARHLMMTGGFDARVNIRVSGRRSDLKELNNETVTAVASLSRITEAGDTQLSWTLEYPVTVAAGDISVDSRSTSKVTVQISNVMTREFPVQTDYHVTTAGDFWTDQSVLSLSESTIQVTGPEEEVSKLGYVSVTLEKDELAQQVDEEVNCQWFDAAGEPVELSDFCSASAETLHLTLPVYHSKTLTLTASCKEGLGATAENARISISPATILVTGSPEELAKLEDTLTVAEVDLGQIASQSMFTVDMDEINALLPDEVINRTAAARVSVTVLLEGLTEKTFTFTEEDVIRLDTLETMELAPQTITLRLRGPEAELNAMQAQDLTLTVNLLLDYDEETADVAIHVQLPAGSVSGILELDRAQVVPVE